MEYERRLTERRRAPLLEPHHLWYAALAVISVAAGTGLLFGKPIIIFGIIGIVSLAIMLIYYPFMGALAYVVFEYARVSAMFPDFQLTGVGLGHSSLNWTLKYNVTGVGGASVMHNIFIQAASELGIGGLIVVVWLLVLIFQQNRETRNICREANLTGPWLTNFSRALDCSLFGFVVHGCFLTVLYYPHLYIIVAMTIAIHAIAKKQVSSSLPAWSDRVS